MNDRLINQLLDDVFKGIQTDLRPDMQRFPNNKYEELKTTLILMVNELGLLLKPYSDRLSITISPFGKQVCSKGGWLRHLELETEKLLQDKARQRLTDEKLKYDVKNAKRIFKTYWWTFGISIAAFILALGKIIYDKLLRAK